jgi:hypothetical protein
MSASVSEITINGTVYIPKSEVTQKAESMDGLEYVIVRTYSAGVFAGYLKTRNGKEVVMIQARRLWYWDGAASLSELAVRGTSKPGNCKFPTTVAEITLTEAIEIIPCTEIAKKKISEVTEWKA